MVFDPEPVGAVSVRESEWEALRDKEFVFVSDWDGELESDGVGERVAESVKDGVCDLLAVSLSVVDSLLDGLSVGVGVGVRVSEGLPVRD